MLSTGFFQALGIILSALLIIGTSVGTWAALRTGKQSQIIKNYRDAANSWREKSEAQEAISKEQQEEIRQLRFELEDVKRNTAARVSELETQVSVLQGIVTGRDEFDYLNAQVKELRSDTARILTILSEENHDRSSNRT
jgi:hypothetical protein